MKDLLIELIKNIGIFVGIIVLSFLEIFLFYTFYICLKVYKTIWGKISVLLIFVLLLLINSSILLYLLFPYYSDYVYYFIASVSNGNIIKDIIVVSVISVHIYLIFIILWSFFDLKNWHGRFTYITNIYMYYDFAKKRKRYITLFRLTILMISTWCFFAARDLTKLYFGEHEVVLDICNLNIMHIFFGLVVAIFLIILSMNIIDNKPFLKISQAWNWLHYLDSGENNKIYFYY